MITKPTELFSVKTQWKNSAATGFIFWVPLI